MNVATRCIENLFCWRFDPINSNLWSYWPNNLPVRTSWLHCIRSTPHSHIVFGRSFVRFVVFRFIEFHRDYTGGKLYCFVTGCHDRGAIATIYMLPSALQNIGINVSCRSSNDDAGRYKQRQQQTTSANHWRQKWSTHTHTHGLHTERTVSTLRMPRSGLCHIICCVLHLIED